MPVPIGEAEKLDAALAYAARGWRVVPILPGQKHPGLTAWQLEASTDPDRIRHWWANAPHHGVGIVCGRASGLFVLDVDISDGKRGDETLAHLEQRHGKLPDTVEAVTGSGGRHLYFAWPDGVDIRNDAGTRLGTGLDIRGEGGQVLAPPTLHPNGQPYVWEVAHGPGDVTVAEAPGWLLELLTETHPSAHVPAPSTNGGDRPGDRWARATGWPAILEPDGWTVHHVDRSGEVHWTRPGKDHREGTSATTGYRGADVLKIFTTSMSGAGLAPEATYSKLGYLAATRYAGDHSAAAKALAEDGWRTPPVDLAGLAVGAPEGTTEANEDDQFFLSWRAFWQRDHSDQEWLYEPILARGRGHAIYATHKTGKSLLMLWMAGILATGPEPVVVVYLDYEMSEDDLYDRLTDMGHEEETDLDRLRYALLPSLPPLDTPAGATKLMAIVDRVAVDWPDHHVVVIIDTMGRAVTGKENDADTIRDFYRYTGMELKRRGHTWARLDHGGKDALKGQRGTSAKGDDVDVVWKLVPGDDGLILHREASRMGWVPEKVELGRDDAPLRFVPAAHQWLAGTKELAKQLDQLGIPVEWGREKVRRALRDTDIKARNDVLSDALKFRKETCPRSAGTGLSDLIGVSSRDNEDTPLLTCGDSPGDREGQVSSPDVPVSVSPDTDRYRTGPQRRQIIDLFADPSEDA